MPEIVQFRPLTQPTEIAEGLRAIADRLDANDFPVPMQTCVVLLAATTLEGPIDDAASHKVYNVRYDFGPKQDGLTVAGALAWALAGLRA